MLLGELRYKSLAKMRGWNNKYKLVDYTHDVTELDLDYYELDGASIQNIKRSVDSIKNPLAGKIVCRGAGEIIRTDPESKAEVLVKE
jgi:hypothetical protein